MIDLKTLIGKNDFLSGGLVLGALASAVALGRGYVIRGWKWCWRQITVEIEVRNTDAPFDWLVLWLDSQPYTKRARNLIVSVAPEADGNQPVAITGSGDSVADRRPGLIFSPATGNHFFAYRGSYLWLHRDREPAGKDSWRERETFTVTMLGRSQDVARQLLHDAYDAYASTVRQRSRIFLSVFAYWVAQGFVRPRSLESVVLPGDQKERLLADVKEFLAAEQWYHDMGIPYRRGYLLHGVPGSGKSSLIAAVAGAIGMHLYVVNLSSLDDSGLQELLQNVKVPRAIILFEDIDGVRAAQSRESDKPNNGTDRVTVSGLLNAMDGVASRDGYITIMTTNRREMLEPALTRPGRIDLELEFGWATPAQAVELFARFYGKAAAAHYTNHIWNRLPGSGVSMAALQEHYLRHRNDPAAGAELRKLGAEAHGLKEIA